MCACVLGSSRIAIFPISPDELRCCSAVTGNGYRVPMDWLFEELGRHAGGSGSQECHNCGACKDPVTFKCGIKTRYIHAYASKK